MFYVMNYDLNYHLNNSETFLDSIYRRKRLGEIAGNGAFQDQQAADSRKISQPSRDR